MHAVNDRVGSELKCEVLVSAKLTNLGFGVTGPDFQFLTYRSHVRLWWRGRNDFMFLSAGVTSTELNMWGRHWLYDNPLLRYNGLHVLRLDCNVFGETQATHTDSV